ncbi:M56 family metallopeptidase [Polaribacter undariae]|uniref:M56 family metallopeptidase n=1 Tax=Polaribacter sejongensis TaxID=985043 RepID=A0AAJ1VFU5_9FLAO|nr:M56 family metallopeptidase [Polaribacter undariae]MDN3618599.1 M56 family metallopeptidase [Polaribacter undariae]UWD30420.1 M56 family metallopeptidase [Polaribacter undariae]
MIIYLLKSASCLALLLFFYHFILEKEKMHTFNRFYLLTGVIVSFLVPLATITVQAKNALETSGAPIFIGNTSLAAVHEGFNYSQLLIGIYLMISILFLIRFVKNFAKIIQKIRTNETIKYQKAILVLVKDEILPHTFWNFIFINKKDYTEGKIEEELFTHELTHVTQKHTLDVLIIELLQIIFWINPLFIFLKKAIQLNHEFLADQKVIHQHNNTFQYQHILVNKAAWNNEYYLASNLNYSLTKKRLKMMTKQSSQTKILLKKLAVIPLLTGFIFLFAKRVEAQEKQISVSKHNITVESNFPTTGFKTIKGEKYFYVLKDKNYKYYNRAGKLTDQNGEIISSQQVNAGDIIAGQYITKVYDNGEIVSEFKDNTPDAYKNLQKTVSSGIIPPPPNTPKPTVKITNKKDPTFKMNGKVVTKEEINKIDADNIESVNVIKKENGSSTISIKKKKEPIFYLDGKRISKKEMKKVKPDNIESVNVEKDKDGGGSIYITSKKE